MSTYHELKGLKIKYLSSDTSGDRAKEGEVFYNSTSFNMASHISVGAWSSASSLNTARYGGVASGNASLSIAVAGSATDYTAIVEQYND